MREGRCALGPGDVSAARPSGCARSVGRRGFPARAARAQVSIDSSGEPSAGSSQSLSLLQAAALCALRIGS